MNYDGKTNQTIYFQLYDRNDYTVTFIRFEWDSKSVIDSNCKMVRGKTYRKVTPSSLSRLVQVINNQVDKQAGRLSLYSFGIGWNYSDRGNPIQQSQAERDQLNQIAYQRMAE